MKVLSDPRYVRSRSVLVEEIERLDRLVNWLELDLKPDQKWEVPQDRLKVRDLLSSSSRRVCKLKRALSDWDGLNGDNAEGCNSGVATKREGFPLLIRAMQRG